VKNSLEGDFSVKINPEDKPMIESLNIKIIEGDFESDLFAILPGIYELCWSI
jgi:hypothetical protein